MFGIDLSELPPKLTTGLLVGIVLLLTICCTTIGRFLFFAFPAFIFDVHHRWITFDIGAEHRRPHDRHRFLHMSWHCVVYLPVLVVGCVAWVLGAGWEDIAFFVFVAVSTVSLEICIGVILSKATEIEDLSRQTKRVLRKPDTYLIRDWLEYFAARHRTTRIGLAKAGLVTCLSLVLYGSIVGIETQRIKAHSMEGKEAFVLQTYKHQHETGNEPTLEDAKSFLNDLKHGAPVSYTHLTLPTNREV